VAGVSAADPDLIVAVGGRAAASVADGGVLQLPDQLPDAVDTLRRALG
jgi:hypothetical protein